VGIIPVTTHLYSKHTPFVTFILSRDIYIASNGATYGETFKLILKPLHNLMENLMPCHEARDDTKVDTFILKATKHTLWTPCTTSIVLGNGLSTLHVSIRNKPLSGIHVIYKFKKENTMCIGVTYIIVYNIFVCWAEIITFCVFNVCSKCTLLCL
jgi:hypothetical protein